MSKYKNNDLYKLYYSDTDSIVIDRPLDPSLVSENKLGLMKLEKVLTKFIALGPKVYGGITVDGVEFTKVKGFKKKVDLSVLEKLLHENCKIELSHDKWNRSIPNGSITVKETEYTLKPTGRKRSLVYSNGILVGTSNIVISKVESSINGDTK